VDGWEAVRRENPGASQIMLAHTRADVAELNQVARARTREAGILGEDRALATERGERAFAAGDRIMFLRNERSLGVKNGTLGTVERIESHRGVATSLTVRLDDGRQVSFDLKDYAHFDHGYASTIHKSQGVTVDRAHVLATDGLDRHGAYVAMSRHRDGLAVHYGADDFKDRAQLVRTLGWERGKDTTLDYRGQDYGRTFAERQAMTMLRYVALWSICSSRSGWKSSRSSPSTHFSAGRFRRRTCAWCSTSACRAATGSISSRTWRHRTRKSLSC